MQSRHWWCALVVGATLAGAGAAMAQQPPEADLSCPRTRAEVRAECIEFMKTHVWSEPDGDWVLKDNGRRAVRVPEGVTSREQIRAERDAFLHANRWNEMKGQWEPLAGMPPAEPTLSRDEMKSQTDAFMRTHRWDEASGTYVLRAR